MACDIKEAHNAEGTYVAPALDTESQKSELPLQATLKELQEMFASLIKLAESKEGKVSDLIPATLTQLTAQFEELMAESPEKAGELIMEFAPFFEELIAASPEAETQIKSLFSQLFQRYAAKNSENPEKLYQVLIGMGKGVTADMPPLFTEDTAITAEAPTTATATPTAPKGSTLNFNEVFNDPELSSLANIFAALSLAIQQLETTLMAQQADKSIMLSEEGQKEVEMAQDQLQKVIDAIHDMEEAQKKAKAGGLSSMIIGICIAVVGVAFAALTMGVGAAIFMAAVGAFMMSPAFSKTVEALSGAMQPALPPHIADAMAKVIILVVIVGMSFGVGLLSTSAEVAATEGTEVVAETTLEETVEEGGVEGAHAGADAGAKSGAGSSSNMSKASAFAQVQGWTNLAAMNPMQDLLDATDLPMGVKIFLDVLVELLCMVMCFRSGTALMKMTPGITAGAGEPSFLVRNFATISQGARIGQAGMELGAAGSEGYKSYWEFMMADLERKQGHLNADGQLMQILIALNSSLQKSSQEATEGSLQGLEAALQLVQQGAGAAQAKANEVIANA